MAIFICVVVVSITTCVCRTHQNTISAIQNYYAVYEVTDILIYYIVNNPGKFPRNWQDLEETYKFVDSGYNSFSLEELRQRVDIDFAALASGLNTMTENAVHAKRAPVIYVKSDQAEVVATEANERFWETIDRTVVQRRGRSQKEPRT